MKGLSAGLTFLNFSTVAALVLGIISGGLNQPIAIFAVITGLLAGIAAYLGTFDPKVRRETLPPSENAAPARNRFASIWGWAVAACFAIFAVRSFCWLLYVEGDELKIQSVNNLGDLALHITFIRNFANGVSLWPENPIYVFSHLRYPAGVDLFNALLVLLHIDLIPGLVWVGLLASIATCYAFFRWAGPFGIAGFLFNGGVMGFQFLRGFELLDYQGDKTIAWKSIPLSMFVTQRGLLYAIPAGLLLLWHWREKFFGASAESRTGGPLPFWVEVSLYASMPLFHIHTFLGLTFVLVFLFALGDAPMRGRIITTVGTAFIPATFFVALITEFFKAASVMEWKPGWVMHDGDFQHSNFVAFWWINFGFWFPLLIFFLGFCIWRATWEKIRSVVQRLLQLPDGTARREEFRRIISGFSRFCHDRIWTERILRPKKLPEDVAFLFPAAAIFVFALLWKTAPWAWDNLKLMMWGYFLILPYLWSQLIARWPWPVRVPVCVALFGSGFITLFGGLAVGRPGFGFANRREVDWVGAVVQSLPVEARFAAFPTYNHPLLLQGRKVVLGYPGHLWTEGFNYQPTNVALENLMLGKGDWRETARSLRVRYIYWGKEEKERYKFSTRPWEQSFMSVASSEWATIYDLGTPALSP